MLRVLFALILVAGCHEPVQKKTVPITAKPPVDTVLSYPYTSKLLPVDSINLLAAPVNRYEVPVVLQNDDSFHLTIPVGFRLSVAAEVNTRLRFLSLSADGRLFATDMHDRSDNRRGRILIFEGWNDSLKQFTKITTYLDKLHNPNQAAFHGNYLYLAETGRLRRFVYRNGDRQPSDSGQTIATFPDYGLGYKYGGWHLTRSLAFQDNKLYVSVGSSCNACIETEPQRATVIEMNPDGSDQKIFARGLRNSVGLKWIGNTLWGTGMGRDGIGPDKPEDVFQHIDRNGFYGWPYYYQYRQQIFADAAFKDFARPSWVKEPPKALVGFKAHSAPLGFDYFKNFTDERLNNSVLVCLHGSTSVWRQRGNAIVRLEKNDRYTEIVSGFLSGKTEADRHGRPCDILMNSAHSFFFTDDLKGVLYYAWK
jgi:glucose/arabinose dehydrogenase